MSRTILLRGAAVLIGRVFEDADILVAGSRIARIYRGRAPAGAAVRELDLAGMRLVPGFIDIHTHGGDGVDFNRASPEEFRKASRFFSTRGVSSFLPTILADSPETMCAQLESATDPELLADCPQIIGIHLEGPFLSPRYRGAQPERFLRSCDSGLFDELQRSARGGIRLVTLSPELDGAEAFVRKLTAAGVRVSIGHSEAGYDEAMAAIKAGAACATHVMNAMKLLHMHDPAILTAVLESDIYAEMICDGFHLHPPIVRLLLKVKGWERMIAVTDSIMAAGLPDGAYTLGVNDVVVAGGDARLSAGGMLAGSMRAGSTLTMIDAVRNIIRFTGAGLERVAGLVSENPARMLGLFAETGSIAEGKRADLVALGPDNDVAMTMARGHILHSMLA